MNIRYSILFYSPSSFIESSFHSPNFCDNSEISNQYNCVSPSSPAENEKLYYEIPNIKFPEAQHVSDSDIHIQLYMHRHSVFMRCACACAVVMVWGHI